MKKQASAILLTAIFSALLFSGCRATTKSANTSSPQAEPQNVQQSDTRLVKGIDGWEGEITGKPAPKSSFNKLKIGMGMKQVTDIVGQPTDQGAYVTGKAWIPFYFGSDTYRHELVYKGLGRLIFAGGGVGNYNAGHLIHIIHNANEGGYR